MTLPITSHDPPPPPQFPSMEPAERWTSAEVLRRASEITSATDEFDHTFDLSKNCQNAVGVGCLVDCQSIIKNLQDEALAKDRQIARLEEESRREDQGTAAKDARIQGLEERIVAMSLELAVTKARADELEMRVRPTGDVSVTSASSGNESRDGIFDRDELDQYPPFVEPPLELEEPPIRELRWHEKGRCGQGHPLTQLGNNSVSLTPPGSTPSDGPFSAEASFMSAMAASSLASKHGAGPPRIDRGRRPSAKLPFRGGLNESNTSRDTNTGRLSVLSNFFLRRDGGDRNDGEGLEVRFPPYEPDDDAPESVGVRDRGQGGASRGWAPALERLPVEKKCSRAFLEEQGVIFPVSTFEVINKGCVARSTMNKMGGGNQEWRDFG